LDETDTIAVAISHVHLARTPGLVNRSNGDGDVFRNELRVESIHFLSDQVNYAAGNSIAAKRGEI
jgi:hypothetical protein